MAVTQAGARLTALQQKQQLALRAATIRDIIKLYPIWNLGDPGSYDRFVDAVILLVQSRATNSAALAARYYEMFREADLGLTWGKAALLAEPPTVAEITAAVGATARAGTYRALVAGQTAEQAMKSGLVQVSGALSRQVLNGGRQTVIGMARHDSRCNGWIRVSDGDPCAFCAMLLSRGPVYKEESADFEAHDHCGCGAEPCFPGTKWPEANQKYHDLWNQTKFDKDTSPLNAFRRALNGDTEAE